MNRSAPHDAVQRRAALAPDRSLIVQAPAGSGKTTLLVQRYLTVLARVDRPEQVVVITFTRKATGELRQRVLTALQQAANGPADEDRELFDLAAGVLQRDRELDWGLMQVPSRLAIYTIDALCAVLVRQMPWLAGLGGLARIEEQPEALYQQATQNVLAGLNAGHSVNTDLVRVFEHLDNDLAAMNTLLVRMLGRREQWTPYLQNDAEAGEAMRDALQRGLALIIENQLADLHAAISDTARHSLLDLLRAVGAAVTACGEASRLAQLDGLESLPGCDAQSLPLWRLVAELLLTAKGTLRKRDIGLKSETGVDKADKAVLNAQAREVLKELAASAPLEGCLKQVAVLPDALFTSTQWQLLLSLLEVLKLALVELRLIFAREGSIDFSEISAAALQALGPELEPTDLALALDYRIQHLLVDEFQDTSRVHHELVTRLCAGFGGENDRSVFLVGDPMQSIYRFREAEVGLFLDCMQRGLAGQALQTLVLDANFRSRPALVEWVNQTFAGVFPPHHDAPRSCVAHARATAYRAPSVPSADSGVELHGFVDADKNQQAERVVEIVSRIRRDHPQQSIALLVRSRSHLQAILPALRDAGLRYRGVDIEPLAAVPVVRDLHALTRALLQPADRMSWLALLRAPWCGLRLADLYTLVGDDWQTGVFDLINSGVRQARLDNAARKRLTVFVEAINSASSATRGGRLKRRVEACWLALGGPGYCNNNQIADARRYLQLLDEYEAGGPGPDLDRLAARLDKLYAGTLLEEADLDIMTMHKAKGLEFDQVILPHLEKRPRAPDQPLLQWSEVAFSSGTALVFAAKPAPGADERRYRFVNTLEADKQHNEAARLLYVACTRARERLHLLYGVERNDKGEIKAPTANSLLAHLWPVIGDCLRDNLTVGQTQLPDDQRQTLPARLFRLAQGWKFPDMPIVSRLQSGSTAPVEEAQQARMEFDWAGRSARHIGTVVHQLLGEIAGQGLAGWTQQRIDQGMPRYRRELEQLGVVEAQLDSACQRVAEALHKTLNDERGRWILADSHTDSHCELPLCASLQGRFQRVYLDRSFVDKDNVRWIVDYKTGWHAGTDRQAFLDAEQHRYAAQLQGYGDIMRHLDRRPIRLGLYFPLLGGWREWAYEAKAD